jgi:hypothetical protein
MPGEWYVTTTNKIRSMHVSDIRSGLASIEREPDQIGRPAMPVKDLRESRLVQARSPFDRTKRQMTFIIPALSAPAPHLASRQLAFERA